MKTVKFNDVRKSLKVLLRKTFIFSLYINYKEYNTGKEELRNWIRMGEPLPPAHLIKQRVLKFYAKQYQLSIFVETGTFTGRMVQAMKPYFNHLYSIELSSILYEKVKNRFKRSKKITLLQGDSSIMINEIVGQIKEPALFWLDGHYSGEGTAKGLKDTPILEELSAILSSEFKHIIIIDDANAFGSNPSYPDFSSLVNFIMERDHDREIINELNMIRITPGISQKSI